MTIDTSYCIETDNYSSSEITVYVAYKHILSTSTRIVDTNNLRERYGIHVIHSPPRQRLLLYEVQNHVDYRHACKVPIDTL